MTKKSLIIFILTMGLIFSSTGFVAASDSSFILDDATGDVQYYLNETLVDTLTYNNFDIKKVSCVQDGKDVDVELLLNDTGEFESSIDVMYLITIYSTTTFLEYLVCYPGYLLTGDLESEDAAVLDLNGEEIEASSAIDGNKMSISFDLSSSTERIIAVSAATTKTIGDYTYLDDVPDGKGIELEPEMTLTPESGDPYFSNAGETVQFSATLDEGEPEDYNWIWASEDISTKFETYNPSHTFKIPGEYYGYVYVYDGQGNWGFDDFTVTVNGTAVDDDSGSNDEPGFEVLTLVAAIAIAIFVFRKRK